MPAAREDRRPLGVVYTPPEVAGPMVRLVLEPRARGKTAAEILALRVCDPAIGTGAFLVEVVNVLAEHLVAAWRAGRCAAQPPGDPGTWPALARAQVARSCLAGVDIDEAAVAQACAVLGLDAMRTATNAIRTATGTDRGLRVADALALDWRAAYPEVFANGGFDVFVGNPPYIRQESLGRARDTGKASLSGYASFDGMADLYVYFLELAHRVLRPGGAYCLIVPNKWMTVAYGRRLRSFLAEAGSVTGVVDLGRAALFADADAFPSIVWGTVGARALEPIRAVRADEDASVDKILRRACEPAQEHALAPGGDESARTAEVPVAHAFDQPRERWGAEPWHIETASERALLDRLERSYPQLGSVVRERPSRGVVTGLNRAFVIDRETRDRLLADEPAAASLVRPFVKGRDIRRWRPERAERWILLVDRGTSLDELPAVRRHLAAFRDALEPRPPDWTGAWTGRKPGTYAWYELQDPVGPLVRARAPRLLYQDIQTGPACCLDDGDIVPDTTVWLLPTADRFVLAVLNSPLYGWYARRRFPPALNGAVRPKADYLRTLPIAAPASALRAQIEQLVDRRLALEPAGRAGGADARQLALEIDDAIANAIADAYALSRAERRLLATD